MESRLFHWGGNLDPSSPVYVERPEDHELPRLIGQGSFVTVLGPRQMGKTSLLYRVREKLGRAGAAVAYVDLSPSREEPLEVWYGHLAAGISGQILTGQEPPPPPTSHLEFLQFLREIASRLPQSRRLVIMLDEVGAVPEEYCDAFFGNIRYVFSNRQVHPEFQRTGFVLCGTFHPRDLIKNPANSPFNISRTLRMSDLPRDGVRQLLGMLERMGVPVAEDVPDEVYGWTGGQPYLTQRLCATFEEWRIPLSGPEVVERAVQEIMVEDVNLDHIVHRLRQNSQLRSWLEKILVHKKKIRFNRMTNPFLAGLELLGVIQPGKDGTARIRNRIYHELLLGHFFEVEQREPASAAAPAEEHPGPHQECTAMSVDVVNSTLLKRDQDKVAVTYTFQQYFQYVQSLVRRYRGQVKDAAGDGVMCIFSTPEEAVRCAWDIQAGLPAFNRRHNRLGGPLTARIGINTGSVLARDLDDSRMTRHLYDLTLDLAGKAQKGAAPGEVALTHHTAGRLRERFSFIRQEFWPEYNLTVYVLRPRDEVQEAPSSP